jgi:hypothetical protein
MGKPLLTRGSDDFSAETGRATDRQRGRGNREAEAHRDREEERDRNCERQ